MSKLNQPKVLRYQKGRRSQDTVRRHYIKWRLEQEPPIPERCDNPECKFNTKPLVWNGKKLNLILDHINGVNGDNRPENLQFLCPNCNSQQRTQGGYNKNRVIQSPGGFVEVGKDGKKHYNLPAEPGEYSIKGSKVKLKKP